MELVSLYYFTELADTLNFTKTAERLFITQQTLSNHIARLEEYYEMPLFYRTPSLSLTPAGELVLAFANSVDREHTNLKDMLADMKKQESGVLRIGGSPFRINGFLTQTLPKFTERYPKVEVRFVTLAAKIAENFLFEGKLDFVVRIYSEKNPNIISHHLIGDQIYLAVSESLLRKYYGGETDALKQKSEHGADIADFAKLPFCLSDNLVGAKVKGCFEDADVKPWAYIISDHTHLSATVACEGLAAAFIPQIYFLDQPGRIPKDINIFPLLYRGKPLVQNISLVRRKDRYLTQYRKFFMDLLFRYYADVEHMHFDRIV